MRWAAALVIGCVIASPALVTGQTFTGALRGSVGGPAGIVSDATVRLVDEDTGLTRDASTNGSGEFAFPGVRPGLYILRVTADGYKVSERSGLRVETQSSLTIDVTLDLGSLSEVVKVEAPAPLVETTSASVGTLLPADFLQSLPSAGRNIFHTAGITPTVIPTGDLRFVRQQDQSNSSLISMAGGARRNNTYVVEGVPIVDILNRATFIPSFHAIEEMRVQLSAYDAQVGRTSGGVFNTVGRSGTNQWRGTGLYQNRPSWGQAEPYFAKKNGLHSTADTYYHLFGGGIGGPLARNRTFVYASTEGYRSLTTRSASMVLPTDAERRGDFSRSPQVIYDPLTTRPDPARPGQFVRDPFPGNQIPAARLAQCAELPVDTRSASADSQNPNRARPRVRLGQSPEWRTKQPCLPQRCLCPVFAPPSCSLLPLPPFSARRWRCWPRVAPTSSSRLITTSGRTTPRPVNRRQIFSWIRGLKRC